MESEIPAQNEAFLVAQARKGEEAAWRRLVLQYQDSVFRLAYLITGSAEDAEDVAQEAFIRAFLKLDHYDGGRPLRPWLLAITGNLARNKRRSIGRYWHAVQRFLQAHREETAVSPAHDPGDAQLLRQAIQKLPQDSQSVIYLRYFLGLSEAETAETLAIAPGTVKSRAHRSLKKLRLIVEHEYPELSDERIDA
ncbi:MAG: RNA polymerase sigma factor [Candidatus Promineifilaceae bacterium]|jgi:RNA polymerase sigma-70 factor (ECF subfamily)